MLDLREVKLWSWATDADDVRSRNREMGMMNVDAMGAAEDDVKSDDISHPTVTEMISTRNNVSLVAHSVPVNAFAYKSSS